ncbi:MAG: GNAT family N-acetyltransferase, partial [Deltaproteobacteria bacterium]
LERRGVRTLMGERRTVGEMLAGMGAPRIPGRDERLFAATPDSMGPYVTPALRPARDGDLPRLLELTEGYYRERRLPPPPEGLEAQVRRRIAAGRIRVLEHEGTVAFRVDIANESRHGAHLDVIYTAPEFRGRSLASLGLGQLARSMLSRIPRITAVAEEADEAAAVVIRRVGFGPAAPWRRVDLPQAMVRAQVG